MSNTPTITATPAISSAPTAYTSIQGTFEKKGTDEPNGTSAADSMDAQSFTLLVEAGKTATVNATIGVDDWGSLTITNAEGAEVLKLSLTSADDAAGPRGGHAYWTKAGAASLPAGTYTIAVEHQNVTYSGEYDPKYNDSKCDFSITAVHASQPVVLNASAQVRVTGGTSSITLQRSIPLTAELQGEGANKQITNLEVGEYDGSSVVQVYNDGRFAKIELLSVTAQFEGETIVDSSTNTVARKARLFWRARIIDPLHTENPDRVVEAHTGQYDNGMLLSPDAVFSASVE